MVHIIGVDFNFSPLSPPSPFLTYIFNLLA